MRESGYWQKADGILVHAVSQIGNKMEHLVRSLLPLVEQNVAACLVEKVARYGMHRVALMSAFHQIRVVGTAHTWLMAACSYFHRL